MKYGRHVEERLKEPENSIEHWREQVAEYGVEHVKKLLEGILPISEVWPISARQAVEEAEEEDYKKHLERERAREKREEETLVLAREANEIAKQAKREMRYTWAGAAIAAFVGAAVTIVLAQRH